MATLVTAPLGLLPATAAEPSAWASHRAVAPPAAGPTVNATTAPDGATATRLMLSAPPVRHSPLVNGADRPVSVISDCPHDAYATLLPSPVMAGRTPGPTFV